MKRRFLLILLLLLFGVSASDTLLMAQNRLLVAGRYRYRGTNSAIVSPARRVSRHNGLHTGRNVGSHFLIGFTADAGYTLMTTEMPAVSMFPGGGMGSIGLAFSYQTGLFDFQTGMIARYQRLGNAVSDFSYARYGVPDSWTGAYDRQYCDVTYTFSQRNDITQNLYFQVPILFGFSAPVTSNSFYMQGGVKVQYAMAGSTRSRALCTTTATYDRYMGVLGEMDNHGLRREVQLDARSERPDLKVDLLASLEMGCEFGNPAYRGFRRSYEVDWRVRLGLFADYSMLNVMPETRGELITIPSDTPFDFSTFQLNHPFGSTGSSNYWMRNLFAGVRLTVLIGVKMNEKCLTCQAYNGGRHRR